MQISQFSVTRILKLKPGSFIVRKPWIYFLNSANCKSIINLMMPKCSIFRAPVKALRAAYSIETFGRIDVVSLWRSLLWSIKIGVKEEILKYYLQKYWEENKNRSSVPATVLDLMLWCWRKEVSVTTNQRYFINSCFLWDCWGKFYNVVLDIINFVTLTLMCWYTIQIALVSWAVLLWKSILSPPSSQSHYKRTGGGR